ncbi:hypothetical protein [Armatimonas sp.]|uniref:hypothetical protein n=1 Tax=Armatimonas sp. TaxID=1872638 RepID=UPI00286D062B|nr:hypothetical protein [Armatimonas sp.]
MSSSRATVTYRPDTDEERLIALLSHKTGLDTSRLLGLAVRQMAEREGVADAPHVRLSAEEQAQLEGINHELPRTFWKRYRALVAKLEDETLTQDERQEFLTLTQKSEAWNVRRLELLEALAQKRGMHFPELMKALEIQHHPHARSGLWASPQQAVQQ